MLNKDLIEKQRKEKQFEQEVISPLAYKIVDDVISAKLTYNQVGKLLKLVEDCIKERTIY